MLQAFEAEGGMAGLGARHEDDERVVAEGNAVEVFVDGGEQRVLAAGQRGRLKMSEAGFAQTMIAPMAG